MRESHRGKNGAAIGREHAERLRSFFSTTPLVDLPRSGKRLNKSLIAEACGFDRQVFRTNPACGKELATIEAKLGSSVTEVVSEMKQSPDDSKREAQAEIDRKYLLVLADNAALRKLLERYRNLESMMLKSGKLPPPTPGSLFDFSNRTQPSDRCSPSR